MRCCAARTFYARDDERKSPSAQESRCARRRQPSRAMRASVAMRTRYAPRAVRGRKRARGSVYRVTRAHAHGTTMAGTLPVQSAAVKGKDGGAQRRQQQRALYKRKSVRQPCAPSRLPPRDMRAMIIRNDVRAAWCGCSARRARGSLFSSATNHAMSASQRGSARASSARAQARHAASAPKPQEASKKKETCLYVSVSCSRLSSFITRLFLFSFLPPSFPPFPWIGRDREGMGKMIRE